MFLLGASRNIRAKPLADVVDVMIEVIRIIVKRENLVADSHSLRFLPCTGASEHAGCHDALIATARAVRGCFDQLDLDARGVVTSISLYSMVRKGTSGANSHMPDLDMIFTLATLQAGPGPTLGSCTPAAGEPRPSHCPPSNTMRATDLIIVEHKAGAHES